MGKSKVATAPAAVVATLKKPKEKKKKTQPVKEGGKKKDGKQQEKKTKAAPKTAGAKKKPVKGAITKTVVATAIAHRRPRPPKFVDADAQLYLSPPVVRRLAYRANVPGMTKGVIDMSRDAADKYLRDLIGPCVELMKSNRPKVKTLSQHHVQIVLQGKGERIYV